MKDGKIGVLVIFNLAEDMLLSLIDKHGVFLMHLFK
jgi:hypothetical protein